MEIQVNGEKQAVEANMTVRQLIETLGLGDAAVAVELNRDVVPRKRHEDTVLGEGDVVELVTLVGGG